MSDTIKLAYSSSANINFRGEIETGIERLFELVSIYVKD